MKKLITDYTYSGGELRLNNLEITPEQLNWVANIDRGLVIFDGAERHNFVLSVDNGDTVLTIPFVPNNWEDTDKFQIYYDDLDYGVKSNELNIYRNTALGETPAVVTSSSSGIYGWTAINPNTETVYLKLFSTATATVGVTAPIAVIPIPAGDGTNPGIYAKDISFYRSFSTALSVAVVTGLADDDATAPTFPVYLELVWL